MVGYTWRRRLRRNPKQKEKFSLYDSKEDVSKLVQSVYKLKTTRNMTRSSTIKNKNNVISRLRKCCKRTTTTTTTKLVKNALKTRNTAGAIRSKNVNNIVSRRAKNRRNRTTATKFVKKRSKPASGNTRIGSQKLNNNNNMLTTTKLRQKEPKMGIISKIIKNLVNSRNHRHHNTSSCTNNNTSDGKKIVVSFSSMTSSSSSSDDDDDDDCPKSPNDNDISNGRHNSSSPTALNNQDHHPINCNNVPGEFLKARVCLQRLETFEKLIDRNNNTKNNNSKNQGGSKCFEETESEEKEPVANANNVPKKFKKLQVCLKRLDDVVVTAKLLGFLNNKQNHEGSKSIPAAAIESPERVTPTITTNIPSPRKTTTTATEPAELSQKLSAMKFVDDEVPSTSSSAAINNNGIGNRVGNARGRFVRRRRLPMPCSASSASSEEEGGDIRLPIQNNNTIHNNADPTTSLSDGIKLPGPGGIDNENHKQDELLEQIVNSIGLLSFCDQYTFDSLNLASRGKMRFNLFDDILDDIHYNGGDEYSTDDDDDEDIINTIINNNSTNSHSSVDIDIGIDDDDQIQEIPIIPTTNTDPIPIITISDDEEEP